MNPTGVAGGASGAPESAAVQSGGSVRVHVRGHGRDQLHSSRVRAVLPAPALAARHPLHSRLRRHLRRRPRFVTFPFV